MSTPDLFLRNLPAGINVFELEEWIEQQTPALGRFFRNRQCEAFRRAEDDGRIRTL